MGYVAEGVGIDNKVIYYNIKMFSNRFLSEQRVAINIILSSVCSGRLAALLGRAAAVPREPAALRHGGRAAGLVRALRARRRAEGALQASPARRASTPQLRLHHLRDVAGRARLSERRGQ